MSEGPIPPREPGDYRNRNDKRPSPLGKTIFYSLRALDPFLYYYILSTSFPVLGAPRLPILITSNLSSLSVLGLSPYRSLIYGLTVGSAVKQILYMIFLNGDNQLPPSAAILAGGWNLFINSVNCFLATSVYTSAITSTSENLSAPFPLRIVIGTVMFFVGNFLESYSEYQRKVFKDDRRNQGKAFTQGLFGTARHVNYGGYTIWRCGMMLASGGIVAAGAQLVWLVWCFTQQSIPALDKYCAKRYGQQWVQYRKDVPARLWWGIL